MKYDSQIGELKNQLTNAKSVLIALPVNPSIDTLASSLALFLTLESQGKQVSVVCWSDIRVGQSYLFGVDHVQKTLPSTEGGNLTLTLEGVAASDNTVPALEKLDWYAENSNLNLVFHVLPGQNFQPRRIVPHYQGSGFNLIFVIGASNLNSLGQIYQANAQAFSGSHIVNIDNQVSNTSFGQSNVLDNNASSVSEIMVNLLADLSFNLDADTASNLLAGIFEATSNLTSPNLGAETYMSVANCLRAGGKKPSASNQPQPASQVANPQPSSSEPQLPTYDWNALMQQNPNQAAPVVPTNQPQQTPNIPDYAMPPVVSDSSQSMADVGDHETISAQQAQTPAQPQQQTTPQYGSGSPEERPAGEGVISETVEPEWLTPKIFKGSNLG